MKVLFVVSGNKGNINALIKAQARSLELLGITIDFYQVQGKGVLGYLKNIPKLRNFLKQQQYEVVHAHYSFCGFVAALSGAKPLVVSLMGSDVKSGFFIQNLTRFFARFFWHTTIVKSSKMKEDIKIKQAIVVPNGVNLQQFKPIEKQHALAQLKWDESKIHLVFAAHPNRVEKNFALVEKAFLLLNTTEIELHTLQNVPFEQMNLIYNASDGVLLSSLWEGSPNVIKETMACNKPFVCTNVGDVKQHFGTVPGCFISDFTPEDYAKNIKNLIEFVQRKTKVEGLNRIMELELSSETIAKKIVKIYQRSSKTYK